VCLQADNKYKEFEEIVNSYLQSDIMVQIPIDGKLVIIILVVSMVLFRNLLILLVK
jgi:hypothetical protein